MANYKTHALFNLIVALPLLSWGAIALYNPTLRLLLIFGVAFAYATLFMNPDLDLAHQIKPLSLRGLLTLPFRGYSAIFRHRGLSHFPLIGTATRLLWLGALAYVVLLIIHWRVPPVAHLMALIKTPPFLFALSGVVFADLAHLLLDIKAPYKKG